jgi:hypothetical protein
MGCSSAFGKIDEMAQHIVDGWPLDHAYMPLYAKDIAEIFRASL